MLIDLAASAQLFHHPIGTAYADLLVDSHRETWSVRSPRFRAWLRRRYYAATGQAPSAAELASALNRLPQRLDKTFRHAAHGLYFLRRLRIATRNLDQ